MVLTMKTSPLRPTPSTVTGRSTGDAIIGDLVDKGVVLIHMAIDHHGRLGPMVENLLFCHTLPHKTTSRSMREIPQCQCCPYVPHRDSGTPAPTGIVQTATSCWRVSTCTAPTPREYTIQKLWLGITKALALHQLVGSWVRPRRPLTPPVWSNPQSWCL